MADTGWLTPSSVTEHDYEYSAGRFWSNEGDARFVDGSAATITDSSSDFHDDYLRLALEDQPSIFPVLSADDKADALTPWPGAFTAAVYGGPADTWGSAIDRATVQGSEFGVVFRPNDPDCGFLRAEGYGAVLPVGATVDGVEVRITRRAASDAYSSTGHVDAVEMRVHYTDPGPSTHDETGTAAVRAGGTSPVSRIHSPGTAGHGLPDGVVACYDRADGPTYVDAAGGFDGTIVGAVPGTDPDRGPTLTFSGTQDEVDLPHDLLDGRTAATVSLWFRTSAGDSQQQAFVSGATPGDSNSFLMFLRSPRDLRFYHHDGPGGGTSFDCPKANDGAWHHVALVYRSGPGAGEYFFDGASLGAKVVGAGGAVRIDPGGLKIGQEQDSVGGGYSGKQRFVGDLSQVRFFDRALSAAEVETVRTAGNHPEGAGGIGPTAVAGGGSVVEVSTAPPGGTSFAEVSIAGVRPGGTSPVSLVSPPPTTPSAALSGRSDPGVVSTVTGTSGANWGGSSTEIVVGVAPAGASARLGGSSPISLTSSPGATGPSLRPGGSPVEPATISSILVSGPSLRVGGSTGEAPPSHDVVGTSSARLGGGAEEELERPPLLVTGLVSIRLPHSSRVRIVQGFGEGGSTLSQGLVAYYRPSPSLRLVDALGNYPDSGTYDGHVGGPDPYLVGSSTVPVGAFNSRAGTDRLTVLVRTAKGTSTTVYRTVNLRTGYQTLSDPQPSVGRFAGRWEVNKPGDPAGQQPYDAYNVFSPSNTHDYDDGEPVWHGWRWAGPGTATCVGGQGLGVFPGVDGTWRSIDLATIGQDDGMRVYGVAVWDRALTDAEYAELRTDPAAPLTEPTPLVPLDPWRVRIRLPHSSYAGIRLPNKSRTDTEV